MMNRLALNLDLSFKIYFVVQFHVDITYIIENLLFFVLGDEK